MLKKTSQLREFILQNQIIWHFFAILALLHTYKPLKQAIFALFFA
jgi:hypothetical protein